LIKPKLPKHFHSSKNLRLFHLPLESCALRISISKKNFKLAVDRNKIKRQVKEIFKKNNLLKESGAFVVLVYKPFSELKFSEASVEVVKAVESLYQNRNTKE
jgi:ribonuclease P protein component